MNRILASIAAALAVALVSACSLADATADLGPSPVAQAPAAQAPALSDLETWPLGMAP